MFVFCGRRIMLSISIDLFIIDGLWSGKGRRNLAQFHSHSDKAH